MGALLGFLNYRRMFWVRGVFRLNTVLEFRVWSFSVGFVGVGNFAIGFGFELCLVAAKVC